MTLSLLIKFMALDIRMMQTDISFLSLLQFMSYQCVYLELSQSLTFVLFVVVFAVPLVFPRQSLLLLRLNQRF